MAETPEKYVQSLLREFVPAGERNSSQRIARAVLGELLQAMWGTRFCGDAPTSTRGCIDIAEVTAQVDDPDFRFAYDARLLDAVWFERARTHA